MHYRFWLIAALCYSLYGCYPRPYAENIAVAAKTYSSSPDRLTESLFDTEGRTISEADITRVLDGYIEIPDSARVALLNLESATLRRYYPSYWSDENYRLLQQSFIDTLEHSLWRSDRVQRVNLLPQLLLSNDRNIFTLRESAVRMQADLLFIFSIYSNTYNKVRVFNKDQTKAYATCEGLLLDIRTGIVPFSTVVSRDYVATNQDSDASAADRSRRAETEASLRAVAEVAVQLRTFLTDRER